MLDLEGTEVVIDRRQRCTFIIFEQVLKVPGTPGKDFVSDEFSYLYYVNYSKLCTCALINIFYYKLSGPVLVKISVYLWYLSKMYACTTPYKILQWPSAKRFINASIDISISGGSPSKYSPASSVLAPQSL